jgi:hypothetical protein
LKSLQYYNYHHLHLHHEQESDLVERARHFIDCVTSMDVVIDGNKLQGLSTCRASSNIFDLRFPEDNVYDVEPGPTLSVADGYWIFMRRISPGKHVLSFRAKVSLPRNSILVLNGLLLVILLSPLV